MLLNILFIFFTIFYYAIVIGAFSQYVKNDRRTAPLEWLYAILIIGYAVPIMCAMR